MKSSTLLLSYGLFSSTALAKAWSAAAAAAASSSCQTYALQPKDTCWNIMRNTNATFAQIISWNSDINKQCSNLNELEGQDICISNPEGDYAIPTNSQGVPTIITTTAPIPTPTPNDTEDRCAEYHLVQAGEDCADFVTKYEITKKDFLFLNPHVSENCTNVWLDYWYCVRPVGYISTYPGYFPPTTTKEFVKTPTTKVPNPPNPDDLFPPRKPRIPLAKNTRKDCEYYEWFDDLEEFGDDLDCWDLAAVYDISSEELVLWNPSLAQDKEIGTDDSTYTYPCSLSESVSYCVALESSTPAPIVDDPVPPSPRAAGEIENCTFWYQPGDWETCEGVLLNVKMNIEQFYYLNPSIKIGCTGLTAGTFYCVSVDKDGDPPTLPSPTTTSTPPTSTGTGVSTPTPTQDNMVETCDEFYLVKAGDLCNDIANKHDISRADFDRWNPAVKNDCTGLIAEYYVCVGSYAPSPPPTTTTDGGHKSTPTPTQSGMVDGCGEFHLVKSGDGCWDIADSYGIPLDDFYEWNPAVKDDCTGLLTEFYVCMGRV